MCDVDNDRGDTWKVWKRDARRARKHHTCDCCGARIQPGEPYEAESGLLDTWSHTKGCFICWWVREAFAVEHGNRWMNYQEFMTQLRECVDTTKAALRMEPRGWSTELAALTRRWRVSRGHREQQQEERLRRAVL